MLRRSHYVALGMVILLMIVILRLPSHTAAQLKLAVSAFFLPLFGLNTSAAHLAQETGNLAVPRRQLLGELEQLRLENQQLRIGAMQAEDVARENARLRQYVGLPRRTQARLKLARVVSRDPANWWHRIKIDRGLHDGVVTNSAVLTAEGLVGRVAEVGYRHAQVVLVGDPDCKVSVLIEETREHGVIVPESPSVSDNVIVNLDYLSRNSLLKSGQRVVTSGEGGVFPQGILVGHVADFRSVDYGLYLEARVRVAVKLNTLEEVWVTLP